MLLITHFAEKHFRYIFQQLPQYIKQNAHLRPAVKNAPLLPSFVFAHLLSLPTFYQILTHFLNIINSYFFLFLVFLYLFLIIIYFKLLLSYLFCTIYCTSTRQSILITFHKKTDKKIGRK